MKFRNESIDNIKTNSDSILCKQNIKMNRNSGNVSKPKKLISGVDNNSKHNRKTFQNLSDSSSISSNRNSSAQSEEDVRVSGVYLRPQVDKNTSYEEQEQITKKLQAQVKELRHKLRILEESVDSKDYSLGTIARQKDRAIGEIRRLERSNKLLRQQLSDERNHYLEEKERFCEEMTRYKKKLQVKSDTEGKKSAARQPLIKQSLRWQLSREKGDSADVWPPHLKKSKSKKPLGVRETKLSSFSDKCDTDSQIRKSSSVESFHLYEGDDVSLQMAALRTENAKLRSIICEKDERNYELCLRFLRMKHYKNDIKDRFQDLENEYLQVIANLMDKIDEARQEFNFIIDQKFKRPMHSTNAMYLQMVQKNSRMAFENASLRLENQCLKKELKKCANNSSESDRKMDIAPGVEELTGKMKMEETKTETKLKRIKKNVNFKEVQTIYERYLTFKNSDTDSNYMSKTSTTVPSNGSLVDPNYNESIAAAGPNEIQPGLQANTLPDEILQKIFKRIDTSSCQTVDSGRSKVGKIDVKSKHSTESDVKSNGKWEEKLLRYDDPTKEEPIIIENKSPSKTTDSSSPCESKESIHVMETAEATPYSQRGSDEGAEKPKKENWLTVRRQEKQETSLTFKNRLKPRVRCDWNFDMESEERSNSLDFSLRKFTFSGRSCWRRQEKISNPIKEREILQIHRTGRQQLEDSCGLQEKLEFSDFELPVCGSVPGVDVQPTAVDPEKATRPEESEEEDLRGKQAARREIKNVAPAVGSRSRSSNKVNLQDELMEAGLGQFEEPVWRIEKSSIRSTASTMTHRSDRESEKLQDESEVRVAEQETDVTMQRKPEASKRFSHRLFSSSPEQLKNILKDSQLGPFRVAPVIVSHATTELTPVFKFGDSNNEIFFKLVLPPQSPTQSTVFSDNEKPVMEKEVSPCETSPAHPQQSNQTEGCPSDNNIPISSLPTSSSTMEMIDSSAFQRSTIMMRTLSAPGLLESNWLDPYTVFEMRDCSTNT